MGQKTRKTALDRSLIDDHLQWFVVSTADGKGVAIKPKRYSASRFEVCVALRDGMLHINLYEDNAVFPIFELTKRVE